MLNSIVINPIRRMSEKANEISMGALNVEELEITGSGEISTLSQSFNRMHRSLASAVKMLDELEE
jgi:protein-histidine pros-kinase